ncbi:short-subunit dehydrogenase [Elusimicrobium simillimum]|uniref:SDR family NAD(P)-dependent oxidoreductase n=1 Tax=Elusimicrobium simillimum TaxID=3143438 RepID=UPI003C6FAD36
MQAKNVLIIGGTTGIGRELAKQYIAKDCIVAVTGRSTDKLDSLRREYPDNVFTYTNDVRDSKSAELLPQIARDLGDIDTIILCAGVGRANTTLNNDWEVNTTQTNVTGFTDWADTTYKYLEKRFKENGLKGQMAGLCSIASFRGSDTAPAYHASKAYVRSYLQGLRKKTVKDAVPVQITTIIPGWIDTELAESVGKDKRFWMAPVGKAAQQMIAAIERGRKNVFITKRWILVALVMCVTPDFLYNRFY